MTLVALEHTGAGPVESTLLELAFSADGAVTIDSPPGERVIEDEWSKSLLCLLQNNYISFTVVLDVFESLPISGNSLDPEVRLDVSLFIWQP